MELRRDAGCVQALNWQLLPADAHDLGEALRQVARLGWAETAGIGEMVVFAVPGGHRLMWIPSSGRLQLRLDYGVSPELRPGVALAVATRLGVSPPASMRHSAGSSRN